jgi:hypothetical protein
MRLFRLLGLSIVILVFAVVAPAQEKATWTANPAMVYQQKGAYPSSPFTVRLYSNKCQYDGNGDVKPGTSLDTTSASVYSISVTGAGATASQPTVGDCSLTTSITISPSAQPGYQMLAVKVTKGGVTQDTGFAPFDLMAATAGPIPGNPQVDVLWDVLTDHLCRDNFGNHMPHDLYCVEVKIGNDSGYPLQLAGVGFRRPSPQCTLNGQPSTCPGFPGDEISTPNISYQTARASAQAGITTSARNIIVNGTEALGLLMASFTPFFENTYSKGLWTAGTTVVGTGVSQAINLVAPDLTVRELNNLDDQAFRDGKLIPNNTQVRMLVFVQKKSVAEAIGDIVPKIKDDYTIKNCSVMPAGYKAVPGQSGECYPGWEDSLKDCVSKLVCNPLIVKLALGRLVIVGDYIDYVQRVVVDTSVTSQEVNPQSLQSSNITPVSIAVTPTSPSIAKGATQLFKAVGTYSNGTSTDITTSVTWASSTPANVAFLPGSPAGVATGVAASGGSSITAMMNGVSSNADSVTATAATLASIAVTPTSPSIAKGATQQFKATGTNTDGTTNDITATVSWTSGTTAVATINAAGLATGVAAGASQITATMNGVISVVDTLTVAGP